MALTVQPGTDLEREVETYEFIKETQLQILEGKKYLWENSDFDTIHWRGSRQQHRPYAGTSATISTIFSEED